MRFVTHLAGCAALAVLALPAVVEAQEGRKDWRPGTEIVGPKWTVERDADSCALQKSDPNDPRQIIVMALEGIQLYAISITNPDLMPLVSDEEIPAQALTINGDPLETDSIHLELEDIYAVMVAIIDPKNASIIDGRPLTVRFSHKGVTIEEALDASPEEFANLRQCVAALWHE